jgi:soluble lytic murein transglycosylase-like protein
MNLDQLRTLITSHPDRGSLPVECVMAVCMVESSLRPYAIKYEDHYRWLVGDQGTMPTGEKLGQKHSWGIMQVMGAVARELGFAGPFTDLWEPEIGIRYGMRLLKKLWQRHENWPDVIASYNAGSPIRVDGKYKNQAYVDKVLMYLNEYETHVPLKSTEA